MGVPMLSTARTVRGARLRPALVAAVTGGVLAVGAGQASAAPGLPAAARAGAASPAGTITTVVGGVGGPAKATTMPVYGPLGVTFGAGHVYIADGAVVRAVNPVHDWLTTPAGTGTFFQPIGDGGPATAANLYTNGTAVDRSGNLVIADSKHSQVQVVAAKTGTFYGQQMTAGHIYRVAGRSTPGFSGDGAPATRAQLRSPEGVAVDAAGNLLIADSRNDRIRMVAARTGTFYGQAVTAGDIYTVAGGGTGAPDGGPATGAYLGNAQKVAVDGAGNMVIAAWAIREILVVAGSTGTFYGQAMTAGDIYVVAGGGTSDPGDGGPATSAFLFTPKGVAVDGAGNLVIADAVGERIRVVAHSTGTFYGQAMTAGDIYTVAGNGKVGNDGDGLPATHARLNHPHDVAVDSAGNVLIDDYLNARIRLVAAHTGRFYGQAMKAGHIYSIAGSDGPPEYFGDGGPATHALLANPDGLARDATGNLVIADRSNNRIRVVAAATGTFYGQAMTAGDIYTVAGDGSNEFSGDGGPATSAGLNAPGGVAVDGAGNLVIADTSDQRIRVVADSTGTFYGQAMTAGDIYTVAGDGTAGFSGDGGPATSAKLAIPGGVAVDGAGNLLIADSGNNRIRVVAAHTGTFYGRAMTAGDIYTVAGNGGFGFAGDGGPATHAKLASPALAIVDEAGNLVIADDSNNAIRVVAARTGRFYGRAMTAGDIYTVAGDATGGFSGDGGPATHAELFGPQAVTFDGTGNLVIADNENGRIRVVAIRSGRFYGQAMTVGDIYTIAGTGSLSFSGDGGPATAAAIGSPVAVVAGSGGSVLFADGENNRIRMVSG
jgi:sugar lactone lactonase YvrE